MRVFSWSVHAQLIVRSYGEARNTEIGRALLEGGGVPEKASWGFHEGDEIVAGRHASRLLGGGRRYEAYLAWDDELHTLVVVKIVRPSLVESQSVRAALAGEAAALRCLSHPTIVRMFDAVVDGERPHLVLEHLDGPRLSTLLRRYRVIVEQLLPLALELCSALHYMHGRGFLHLDVKPRNVIMSGRPRLIDLSVATTMDAVGGFTRPVGTGNYMAPEQCEPARFPEIGPASDIWALGVTLYEALSRSLPFPPVDTSAPAGSARYPQLVSDPFPFPKDVPDPLAEAVLSCLDKLPANRPSAFELAATIEPWVSALPAPRLGLFRPGGRSPRSDFAPRDESILSAGSPGSYGRRLLLSSMRGLREREGGTR